MLDNPVAGLRLASAKVVESKKLRDVGVASVILGDIAPKNGVADWNGYLRRRALVYI
jgi:hypothetical protein